MGRFRVHLEGKADITGYQIRCGRVWEAWEEADCSEILREQKDRREMALKQQTTAQPPNPQLAP